MFRPPPPVITLATNLFSSSIILSFGGYCVSRFRVCAHLRWPFSLDFMLWALSRGRLCWWRGPWCRVVLHQEHHSSITGRLLRVRFGKDWSESEGGVGRDSGTWGCGSLCDAAWCRVAPLWPPTPGPHFQSPPTPGAQTRFSSSLRVKEFWAVVQHHAAGSSRGGMLPGIPGILVPARQVPSPECS